MKTILQETTAEVIGLLIRKHQDWFDEADKEIQELPEKKHSCHNNLLTKPDDRAAEAEYKTSSSTLQAKLRTMQNGGQALPKGQRRVMCGLYEALKAVLGPSHQIQVPLRSSCGSTLLVGAFRRPLQQPTHSAGFFIGQDSPSGCEAGAG